ncbi:MAG: PLP-dependent aminotransferase family protein [Cyanobacteria bacterium SZAS LIN-5]|nr:PLP-dependent aminotransferase family protein [Cyanobacteria bacterium SZAS LIN-5]
MLALIDLEAFEGKHLGYLEIAESIIEAIKSGRLSVNSTLPTSRSLAESLGVSRDTVVRCYDHLKSLGWIESHGRKGMFVSSTAKVPVKERLEKSLNKNRLSDYARGLLDESGEDIGTQVDSYEPIRFGVVPKAYRPTARWKKALQNFAAPSMIGERGYVANVLGRPELRTQFSSYICSNRGALCSPEDVVIFNGSFSALSLIFRIFLDPGDSIAIEDPGFGGPASTAAYLGLNVVPIPIDSDGLSVERLANCQERIKLVYVTPNHHEPSGITMTLTRRKQLLAWAQKNDALIIEDEHDGMFHYGKMMPPSLKSMDTQDNVIYLTSFWQILYPLTSLCLTVVPSSLCEVLNIAKIRTANLAENQPQLALSELLETGYLQRHISKLQHDFGPRRRALIYELKRAFGARAQVPLHTGGLKVMVQFCDYSDEAILNAANRANLALASTAPFYQNAKRNEGECVIYFPDLEESSTRKKIEVFKQYLNG